MATFAKQSASPPAAAATLSVHALKSLLDNANIKYDGCVEKSDFVALVKEHGLHVKGKKSSLTLEQASSMPVKDLKRILKSRGVDVDDGTLVDKEDYVHAVVDGRGKNDTTCKQTQHRSGKHAKRRPQYVPNPGHLTDKYRSKYWALQKKKLLHKTLEGTRKDGDGGKVDDLLLDERVASSGLVASSDWNQKLYFWQLYSVLGERRILRIVTDFYDRVYDKKQEKWFRETFERITTKDHAIQAQAAMWIDCMGGGRVYHGGDYRLRFHHDRAKHVMTTAGAKLWMNLINQSLDAADLTGDPRVRGAIDDFLHVSMCSYADEYKFSVE